MNLIVSYFAGVYLFIGLVLFLGWLECIKKGKVELKYVTTYVVTFVFLLVFWPIAIYKSFD